MGDALADIFLGSVDLGADLACFKVAHTPRLCGGAEPAAHAAAHLCGYAHGIAVVVTHDNGLDAVASFSVVTDGSASESNANVDAIGGSTITSKSVTKGVNYALAVYKLVAGN